MKYGIYKFENKINHMIYIGLSSNLEDRYNKHYQNMKDLSHQEEFYKGLREYGWENFDYEILEEFEYQTLDCSDCDYKMLGELEDYYILKYNSLTPNGYNMIRGGHNGSSVYRRKPVEQYDLNGNFIKEYISASNASFETGIIYSDLCKCCRDENNKLIAGGYQWKYKNSNKIIKSVIDKHSVKILYQFDKNGKLLQEYNNLDEAAAAVNVCKSSLCNCCLGKTKSCAGYYWSYNKDFKKPEYKNKGQTLKKQVAQYNKENKLINIFSSVTEAAKQTSISLSNISEVCLGHRKTAGGFIWEYIE